MLHVSGFNNGLNDRWQGAVAEFKGYAMRLAPQEACALILADGTLWAAKNIHPDPERFFTIEPEAWAAPQEVVAVLHSHTPGPDVDKKGNLVAPLPHPSADDMNSQIASGLPWGIVLCNGEYAADPFWFGDQVPTAPLLGRPFQSGIWDCWSLIRDWYKETYDIVLHNEGRNDKWWDEENPPNFYDQFEQAGFVRVQRGNQPMRGDVFVCKVHSPVYNHGGVYLGEGTILHHLAFQLSVRTPAVRWHSKMDNLFRHKDAPDDIV